MFAFLLKMEKYGIPFKRKYPLNSTSLENAGFGTGFGCGGGVFTGGGGRFEPGRKNGLLATPPEQKGKSTSNKIRFLHNTDTYLRFQN